MTKQKFIAELKSSLHKLPPSELAERINFYSEMIDDRIEEGLSEEQAVAGIGSVQVIAAQVLEEAKNRNKNASQKNGQKLKSSEKLLLILGSPLWISFILIGLSVAISIFAVIFSINMIFWALETVFFLFSLLSHYFLLTCKHTTKLSISAVKGFTGLTKAFFRGKEKL